MRNYTIKNGKIYIYNRKFKPSFHNTNKPFWISYKYIVHKNSIGNLYRKIGLYVQEIFLICQHPTWYDNFNNNARLKIAVIPNKVSTKKIFSIKFTRTQALYVFYVVVNSFKMQRFFKLHCKNCKGFSSYTVKIAKGFQATL